MEWNPWISLYGRRTVTRGVLNTYGTVILRFPLAYENFNLRTTLNLGISYLLFDLYGAPKGSLGYYAGVSPLGLEWKLSRMFLLIINPLNIAVPVPQIQRRAAHLSAVPLQHRPRDPGRVTAALAAAPRQVRRHAGEVAAG